jgi:drug/metabolite transporter (DMT)-like permease
MEPRAVSLPVPRAAPRIAPIAEVLTPNTLAGIGMTVLGVLLFSGCNALATHLVETYPAGEMLFVRALTALVLLAPFIRTKDIAAMRRGGKPWLHALRMACSGIEVGCYYWALTALTLAGISTIYMAAPIYTVALSALFLREQVGWRRWLAVLAAFGGVLVALRPDVGGGVGVAGVGSVGVHALVALFGSLLYATSLVATRRLRATPNRLLVASQVAALALFTGASSGLGWVMPTPSAIGQMALIGAVSLIAYLCVNRGLQLAPASAVAPFQYSSIIWAIILGYLAFAEIPTGATLVGATVIVAAGLFILLRERALRG